MPVEIAVGTNSYISVADATTYFGERLFSDSWVNAGSDNQAKSLIMATKKIDRQMLQGKKAVSTQTLEFPRALYRHDPYGYGRDDSFIANLSESAYESGWVTEESVTQDVLDATCEEAIALLSGGSKANQRAELQAQGVKAFSIGKLSETFKTGVIAERLLSLEAKQLLQRYLSGGAVIV